MRFLYFYLVNWFYLFVRVEAMAGDSSKEGLRLQLVQALGHLFLMYLRVIIKKGLQFLGLPAEPQVDHIGQLGLDDHHIVLMHPGGCLGLEYHEHKDGVFEVGEVVAPGDFEFLVGDDEVDDGLDGLIFDDALDLLHELGEVAVLEPETFALFRVLVFGIVELLDQLLERSHLFYALYHEFHALLDLLDLAGVLLALFFLELLQLALQLLDVERVDDCLLAAREEGLAGVQEPDVLEDPAVLVADVLGHVVRVLGEGAANDDIVEEGEQDYELVGEEVEVGLDVFEVAVLGVDQVVQVHLAQDSIGELIIEGLYLQPL